MTVLTHKGGGLRMLAMYLAALYVILPQLHTIGLRGVWFLFILGVPYHFCGSSDSGYSFQYSLSEMDPFLYHFLRMLIILFLYLCLAISSTRRVVGVMAKFKPLLSIDHSSSLICLSLRFNTHLFVSMSVSVTSFLV